MPNPHHRSAQRADHLPARHFAGRAHRRRRGDRGSVTAETAVALPSLVVVLLLAVWVLLCVAAQLRCLDAAHVAARAAARGEDDAEVRAVAARAAPPGADVRVERAAGLVEVRVSAEVQPFAAVLSVLPAVDVSARAVAADEAVQ